MIEVSSSGLNPSNSKRGVFPNLAGQPSADMWVRKELTEAGIAVVRHTNLVEHSEVPTHLTGSLSTRVGKFTFERCWYYWRVEGRVPLAIAKKLYASAVGKRDVRCEGDCGCPAPEKMAKRFVDEKEVCPTKEKAKFLALGLADELYDIVFSDNPKVGALYIDGYDIDSQEGLNLFVRTLKAGV